MPAVPIWVRGGVKVVAADGTPYEQRNRVTLCRCGQSSNKPFCDGTHAHVGSRRIEPSPVPRAPERLNRKNGSRRAGIGSRPRYAKPRRFTGCRYDISATSRPKVIEIAMQSGERMTDQHRDGSTREPTGGRLSESGRVEAFSDGVLAIALTLLALDLRVPASQPGDFGRELLKQWPSYIAYLASFVYIGVIWANHHALFTRIDRVDRGLLARNLALLLPASVLPFPTPRSPQRSAQEQPAISAPL